MAKIKFGQIISEARGKIAGMVFSRNSSCSYIRQKVTPINPQSAAQSNVRGSLSSAAKAWAALTAAVKSQYETQKATFLKSNSIGDAYTVSGFNYFVALCRNLFSIAVSAPSTFPGKTPGITPQIVDVTITHGPEKMELEMTAAVIAADTCILYATAPVSQGKSFLKGLYRQIGTLALADTDTVDITAEYVAKFGAIPQSGEQCGIMLKSVNKTTGHSGAALAKTVK